MTDVNAPSRSAAATPGGVSSAGYAVYDAVGALAGLVAAPLLPVLWLTRGGRFLAERFGHLPVAARVLRRPVWIHAASVGETLAAEPLVQQLRARRPDLPILVSTTSVTGRETARTRLDADAVMLLPVDIGWIVDRVMRRLQPRCLLIVETEMWPALIRAAARYRVPRVMVSGRISARAAARYARIRWLTRPMLAQMSACAMQTQADAARIVALGAPGARVQVVGSLKFARSGAPDADAPHPTAAVAALAVGRPLLVAASTHPGEEQVVLDACAGLWESYPDVLLLIAPRRPERFGEVDALLARSGLRYARRSRVRGALPAETRVLLLDTIGELLDVLPTARAVFVGGTLAPVGGHNVLEPALFGKPVAFGPHTENVAAAATALLDAEAATQVEDAAGLAAEWRRMLADPVAAAQRGARGRAFIAASAAVAERTFEVVRPFLDLDGAQDANADTRGQAWG